MATVPDLNCIDIGSKKVRGANLPRLHTPENFAGYFEFSHDLGFLIGQGHIRPWELSNHPAFLEFIENLKRNCPPNPDHRLGVSRNYVAVTAPARKRELGEFSFSTFAGTNFDIFPLVLPPELEGEILELAVWSEFSKTIKLLKGTTKIVHFHPGGMSLEVNESFDGILYQSGCQEEFGIVSRRSTIDTDKKFEELVTDCQKTFKENETIDNIFDHIEPDTELVFSSRFARKLIRLAKKLGLKGDFPEGTEGWIQNSKLERGIPLRLKNYLLGEVNKHQPETKEHFEANGRLFMLAIMEAVMREVEKRGKQVNPSIIISDARLIYGIAELRRRGSFNDEIMTSTIESHMDAFHYSIPHSKEERKRALKFSRRLHNAIISSDSPSTVATPHQVVCEVAAQLAALMNYFPPEHIRALGDFHAYSMFGANRVPGMPRLTQESIVAAANPDYRSPSKLPRGLESFGKKSLWHGGTARGVIELHGIITAVPENDDEIAFNRSDRGINVTTRNPAVLQKWKSRSEESNVETANNLGLKNLTFSYRG